ncbi:hypothetical protein VTI74DRAFT_1847 [Chaetomium olivicolor]
MARAQNSKRGLADDYSQDHPLHKQIKSIILTTSRLNPLTHQWLAEQRLYATIQFPFHASKPHPITSLVCSILRRPELAAYVRTLSCQGGDPPWAEWQGKVPKIPVAESDLQEPLSFVGKTGLPFRNTWMEELRKGTLDAFLAVLLSQLPRLQRLHLGPVFFLDIGLTGLVLRSILCNSHVDRLTPDISNKLSQLQSVSLERPEGHYKDISIRSNTESVLPFFYLPSLKEMSVLIDDPLDAIFQWPTAQPPSALGLVSLRLTGIRESHLGQLLSAVPRLRSLHWEWCFDPDFEDRFNTPVIDLSLLMPALAHVRDTLTELAIPADCLYANRVAEPFPLRVQGSAKALAGFDQLKKLFIPLVFFTGFSVSVREELASCLPRNLEELTLTDDLFRDTDLQEQWYETRHNSAISTWLVQVEISTPRLRKLCLVLQPEDHEISFDAIDVRNEIRELTIHAGIELEITHVY